MEYRWGHRIIADIPVHLIGPEGVIAAARLRDLSVSGAFVTTAAYVRTLSPIEIVPDYLPGVIRAEASVAAYVVRHTATGFGIEWREPHNETTRLLVTAVSIFPVHEAQTLRAPSRAPLLERRECQVNRSGSSASATMSGLPTTAISADAASRPNSRPAGAPN